jgi:hypothetical protein
VLASGGVGNLSIFRLSRSLCNSSAFLFSGNQGEDRVFWPPCRPPCSIVKSITTEIKNIEKKLETYMEQMLVLNENQNATL